MPSSWCRTGYGRTSPLASALAGTRPAQPGGELFAKYSQANADLAKQWQTDGARELPAGWDAEIPQFPADAKGMASRISGGKVLNAIAKHVPWLIGGSADLAPSTMTTLDL